MRTGARTHPDADEAGAAGDEDLEEDGERDRGGQSKRAREGGVVSVACTSTSGVLGDGETGARGDALCPTTRSPAPCPSLAFLFSCLESLHLPSARSLARRLLVRRQLVPVTPTRPARWARRTCPPSPPVRFPRRAGRGARAPWSLERRCCPTWWVCRVRGSGVRREGGERARWRSDGKRRATDAEASKQRAGAPERKPLSGNRLGLWSRTHGRRTSPQRHLPRLTLPHLLLLSPFPSLSVPNMVSPRAPPARTRACPELTRAHPPPGRPTVARHRHPARGPVPLPLASLARPHPACLARPGLAAPLTDRPPCRSRPTPSQAEKEAAKIVQAARACPSPRPPSSLPRRRPLFRS